MCTWRLIGAGALGAVCLCASVSVQAETHTIYPDGSGDFVTIQAALDQGGTHDEILLAPGIFRGPGNRDLDYHGKCVIVRSRDDDPQTCMLYPEGSELEPHRAVRFGHQETSDAVLEAVTILGGNFEESPDGRGGGILITNGSAPWIRRCIFVSNRAEYGGGLHVDGYSEPVISDCIFMQNHADEEGGGINLAEHATTLIDGCTFWENSTGGYGGAINCVYSLMFMEGCTIVENWGAGLGAVGIYETGALISESIIAFTHSGYGLLLENASVMLECVNIYGNSHGNWVPPFGYQYGEDGNISADPLFCDLGSQNFNLMPNSPCRPATHVLVTEDPCAFMGAWTDDCGEQIRAAREALAVAERLMAEAGLRLAPAEPNPLCTSTRLDYSIPRAADASLRIYNATGRLVRTLIAGSVDAGTQSINWNGTDDGGAAVAEGVYFCRLRTGDHSVGQRVLVVR